MVRLRPFLGLLAGLALVTAAAGSPVLAEPMPATLSLEASATHYLGGDWEHQIGFTITCEGYAAVEVAVDLPGSAEDVLNSIGPVPAGTACSMNITYWPDPGWNADWEEPRFTPGSEFVLQDGVNFVTVDLVRIWATGWPPEEDEAFEHDMALAVNKVLLNRNGGIEVEGTSWCPDAADILAGDFEGDLYANANWMALQYIGKKTAISASYESAIAHPCWVGGDPEHGPYSWETRYPSPDGALQFVYAVNGKFSNKTIHVEAASSTETMLVTQNFAPQGWTSFEGLYVPYDPEGTDINGDGWSVSHHYWFGWIQADLKPITVR
jgi:hypothetical protein